MKKVFTVTEVKGSKRSTNNHYLAALIGVFDWDKYESDNAKIQDWEVCNFKFYKEWAAKTEADLGKYDTPELLAGAKAIISKYPTAELYLKGRAQERVDTVRINRSKSKEGQFDVLCWASRPDLAYRRLNEFSQRYYINLKVVPTVQVK